MMPNLRNLVIFGLSQIIAPQASEPSTPIDFGVSRLSEADLAFRADIEGQFTDEITGIIEENCGLEVELPRILTRSPYIKENRDRVSRNTFRINWLFTPGSHKTNPSCDLNAIVEVKKVFSFQSSHDVEALCVLHPFVEVNNEALNPFLTGTCFRDGLLLDMLSQYDYSPYPKPVPE